MERWCCTIKKCKCYIKCNESREIFGRNVMHNRDADSEACLNWQIFNNSVERKAIEDLCERPRILIYKELRSQDLDTATYNDREHYQGHAESTLLRTASSPNRYWRNSWSIKCCTSANKFERTIFICQCLEKKNVMFSCKTNLQFLSSIDVLYVDGTFRSAPKFFHQLFIIHWLSNGHLHFSYWPINVLWGCIQTYGIRGCKTWCECFSNNCLTLVFLLLSLVVTNWYLFILIFRRSFFFFVSWVKTTVHTDMCYQVANIFGDNNW